MNTLRKTIILLVCLILLGGITIVAEDVMPSRNQSASILDSFIGLFKAPTLTSKSTNSACFAIFDVNETGQGTAVEYSVENEHNECGDLAPLLRKNEYKTTDPLQLSIKEDKNVLARYSYVSGRMAIAEPAVQEEGATPTIIEGREGSFRVITPIFKDATSVELQDGARIHKLSVDLGILNGSKLGGMAITSGTELDSWYLGGPFSLSWSIAPAQGVKLTDVSILLLKNGKVLESLATNVTGNTYAGLFEPSRATAGGGYAIRVQNNAYPYNYTDSSTFTIKPAQPKTIPQTATALTRGLITAVDPSRAPQGREMRIFGSNFSSGAVVAFKNTTTSETIEVSSKRVDPKGTFIVVQAPNVTPGTYVLQVKSGARAWSAPITILEEKIVIQKIMQSEIDAGDWITLEGTGFPETDAKVVLKDGKTLDLKPQRGGKMLIARLPDDVSGGENTLQIENTYTKNKSNTISFVIRSKKPITNSTTTTAAAKVTNATSTEEGGGTGGGASSVAPKITSGKLDSVTGVVTFTGTSLKESYILSVSGSKKFTLSASGASKDIKFKLPCSIGSGSFIFAVRATGTTTVLLTLEETIPSNAKFLCQPTSSPSSSPSSTPSPTYTPSASATNSPSPTASYTPSPSYTPSRTPSPSYTPSTTPSPSYTPYTTSTPSPTYTPSYTPSATPSSTSTPSPSLTTSPSSSASPSSSVSSSSTPKPSSSSSSSSSPSGSGVSSARYKESSLIANVFYLLGDILDSLY